MAPMSCSKTCTATSLTSCNHLCGGRLHPEHVSSRPRRAIPGALSGGRANDIPQAPDAGHERNAATGPRNAYVTPQSHRLQHERVRARHGTVHLSVDRLRATGFLLRRAPERPAAPLGRCRQTHAPYQSAIGRGGKSDRSEALAQVRMGRRQSTHEEKILNGGIAKPMTGHPIVHVEISAKDPAAASKFYRELCGWNIQHDTNFNYYNW